MDCSRGKTFERRNFVPRLVRQMARKKTSQLNPSLLRLGVVIPLLRIVSYRILHWDDVVVVVVVVVWLLHSSLLIALTIAQCATNN